MPVIPMSRLPMANQGAPHYGRAQAPGASYYRNAAPGAQLAANLAGVAEKAAGLWLQANLKAKESKAAMDLDEIRVKAEAAYRDNMTALSQDPDGYETFGDRSQKNFLTLRQDCRELLDGLPAEYRRKAELYLAGQASRWRDDTGRLQYQARVTAMDAQAKRSIQSQMDAGDYDGALVTAKAALDGQVWSEKVYNSVVDDINHRRAYYGKLEQVKANPNSAKELTERKEDGSYKVNIPGLGPQDRERLAKYGKDLCTSNAATLREQMSSDPENFDLQEVERKRLDGQISDDDAQSLSAAHQAYRDRASARSFDYAMQEGTAFDTVEKVEAARAANQADQSLPALERERRDAALAVHALRLKSKAEAEASKEQSELYSQLAMHLAAPGLYPLAGGPLTVEKVAEYEEAKKLTSGQAAALVQTLASRERSAAEAERKTRLKQLEQNFKGLFAGLRLDEVTPEERKEAYNALSQQIWEVFAEQDLGIYNGLQKMLYDQFSPDPKGWRKNEALRLAAEAYFDEQREKDFFSKKTSRHYNYGNDFGLSPNFRGWRISRSDDDSRAGDSYRRWVGLMDEWLARNPKATETELREYGDRLRMRIQNAEIGHALDAVFSNATDTMHDNDLSPYPYGFGGKGRKPEGEKGE